MLLSHQRIDDTVVLAPAGRIDHQSAEEFRDAVTPWLVGCHNGANGHALVFDLSTVDYISSAGLRVLMLASKQTKPAGGRLENFLQFHLECSLQLHARLARFHLEWSV